MARQPYRSIVALAVGMYCLAGAHVCAQAQASKSSASGAAAPDSMSVTPAEVKPGTAKTIARGEFAGAAPANSAGMPTPYPGKNGDLPSPNLVNEAVEKTFPMSREEVLLLRSMVQERAQAGIENFGGPVATPTSVVYTLDLSPGAPPTLIRVAPGQGAIVTFVDSQGKPWPIKGIANFAKTVVAATQFAQTEHQMQVSTTSAVPINVGLAVSLEGLTSAVSLNVISGQTVTDRQAHLVVPMYQNGAAATVGAVRGDPSLAAGDLMSFLLRTPPPSARKLEVEGLPGALAWQLSPSRMVLRTTALVATGHFNQQSLGDGTVVYELAASPMVRVAVGDKFQVVRINGLQTGGMNER